MDIREKKTKGSITNAFLELRSRKSIERITVKELSEKAEISKATFYLHYRDIYDLSLSLETQVIQEILKVIKSPETIFTDPKAFTMELSKAFFSQESIIDILFSGSRTNILPDCLEEELKKLILQKRPELQNDVSFHIDFTYRIQGGYHAYQKHHKSFGSETVINVFSNKNLIY